MKKLICVLAFQVLISVQDVNAQCSRTGSFVTNASDTPTLGSATLSVDTNSIKQLILGSNFSTTDGPDLHVVLCKTAFYNPTTDIIVSSVLTQFSGTQSFSVPVNVQLNDFQYVLIHCVLYNHRFGYAALGNQSGAACSSLDTSNFNLDSRKSFVFPNPTTDKLSFLVKEDSEVFVYDATGKRMSNDLLIAKEKNSISLESFPNGIYFVEIVSETCKTSHKIIKN